MSIAKIALRRESDSQRFFESLSSLLVQTTHDKIRQQNYNKFKGKPCENLGRKAIGANIAIAVMPASCRSQVKK
ncbi:hypothetical protein HNQ34_000385 [Anoxybacillus tepidamans]|uniref:Uncharacterized protein n=1 Tax=Anoxybacteroides tepidamans TaxID=265948 RepID=A0A7W8MTY7_9BACL|nr:hypothetical protein [Anoxybacillus tepidamans]